MVNTAYHSVGVDIYPIRNGGALSVGGVNESLPVHNMKYEH